MQKSIQILIYILVAVFLIGTAVLPLPTYGGSKPKAPVKKYSYIIGCIHQDTGNIKKPLNEGVTGCYLGGGYKNLRIPNADQMKLLKEVFGNKQAIITAITLINHESSFDSNAKGCHKGGCDYGLFQIRDVNGGKKMTQKQQMEWFKARKSWQLSQKGNCYHRVQQKNQELILRCVFARHNGQLSGQSKYSTQRYQEWKFYNEYFSKYDF